ncbi:hypothetical protein [Kitasatospora cineracea]|uniref:hypothetical protein n=1 Tax=Kitasatospora cineracea TaxID=88074 RepID=UPI00369EADD4
MSDPIQPTNVTLGRESSAGPVPPPRSATGSGPVPPKPSAPPSAGNPGPAGPGGWWRTSAGTSGPSAASAPVNNSAAGGGTGGGSGHGGAGGYGGGAATMVAPAYIPPAAPVNYTYNYIVQAAPPAAPLERRFDVRRIHPVRNGLALAIGTVIARAVWNPVLHVFGDAYGVVLLGLTGALLLEWAHHDKLKIRWLVRVHTCSWAAAGIVTPAGLLGLAFIGTGAS